MQPYDRRDNRASSSLVQFIGLAILIHFAVIPLLSGLVPDVVPRQSRPIRLVSLPGKMLRRLKQQEIAAKKRLDREKRNKKKEDKPPENLRGQIVDIPPSPDDRAPEEYDYLSEHNTRTEHETKSRHQTKDYANAMNELTRSKTQQASSPNRNSQSTAIAMGPEQPKDEVDQKVKGRQRVFELPNVRQRDRLALRIDPELGVIANQAASEPLRGRARRLALDLGEESKQPRETGTAPNAGQPAIDLMPTVGVLARIAGAPANDHLGDLEEGEGTFLNSREFKYASFFNRMKRGVSQHWRPLIEYRRRDPSGNIYGQRSRVTVLKVVLTPEGGLEDIEVTHSSGVDFLDNEAVAAFRRAQPFPNPPQGLIDDNTGLIDFPFGFHIEFSRHGLQLPF